MIHRPGRGASRRPEHVARASRRTQAMTALLHHRLGRDPRCTFLCRNAKSGYMVTPICDKCRRRNVVSFRVEPEEAWRTVVLTRWKSICPSCFDAEAERAALVKKVTQDIALLNRTGHVRNEGEAAPT